MRFVPIVALVLCASQALAQSKLADAKKAGEFSAACQPSASEVQKSYLSGFVMGAADASVGKHISAQRNPSARSNSWTRSVGTSRSTPRISIALGACCSGLHCQGHGPASSETHCVAGFSPAWALPERRVSVPKTAYLALFGQGYCRYADCGSKLQNLSTEIIRSRGGLSFAELRVL